MSRPQLPSRRYFRHGMLPQLLAFEAVVRLGSVTRAADALYMAQPTISGHLRKLSETLGIQLFEQQGKRLVPTPAAQALVETTREVFDSFARYEQFMDNLCAQPEDARRLTAYAGSRVLSDALQATHT